MSNIQEIKNKKNEKLMQVLEDLAYDNLYDTEENRVKLEKYYNEIIVIYRSVKGLKDYRHSYSMIFQKLYYLSTIDEALTDTLVVNLTVLYNYIVKKAEGTPNNWIIKYLDKLYDHVTLDVQRLSSQRTIDRNIINDSDNIKSNIAQVKSEQFMIDSKLRVVNNELKHHQKYVEKMDKAQIEVIAVMSIFTSIVLSFVGGMAFSTSVLENIHKTDIYRLLFIMIILGLVLINVIWGLLGIIRYINERIKPHNTPFWVLNAILSILLVLNFIAYKCGAFEIENKMNLQLNSTTSEAVRITNSNIDNGESSKESKTEESEEKESTKESKEEADKKTNK